MTPPMSSCHRLQQQANWCVLACAEMVAARNGVTMQQGEIAEQHFSTSKGFSLRLAEDEFGPDHQFHPVDFDDPNLQAWMEGHLRGGAWIVLSVHCQVWAEHVSQPHLLLSSPYGPFPGSGLHAVVLTGAEAGGALCLDPYFDGDSQPYLVPWIVIARALQSELIVVPSHD